ncbi:MAG: tRNA (adenosine(37)-N6)-dimethylallyltransferase MiaA [Clostridia bacterium]|nr:tRNA (adenosine(37)-N6)-dimethylallyltransferase MiaA [Clostridia bacterium]
MMNSKIPVIAVAGPTASGKSALALRLCHDYNGELISCDSMQIYKGMDIGTAKPSLRERSEIPHHLIDICEPNTDFSAAAFAELATQAIADVYARGKMPILCGGTGLYLDSVLKGVDFGEMDSDPSYRAELLAFAEKEGTQALHDRLTAVDPEAAQAIHPNNVKRVVRALEICRLSGMTKTEWDKKAVKNESPYSACILALDYRNRENLYARIHMRVDEMFATGLEQEVRDLWNAGYLSPNTTAGGAIGYKELLGYLRGEMTKKEAADAIKTATRHYAKRQLTWFRRNPDIHWLYPDDERYEDSDQLVSAAHAIIDIHAVNARNT